MIKNYKELCTGCRVCEKVCPKHAIEMKEDDKGFLYPHVDYNKCTKCGLCNLKCPLNNKNTDRNNEIIAYAAYNKNSNVRQKSSSGGIFSLFAEYVLKKGGAVFGATFDNSFLVEHIYIESIADLPKLRGSKYVQSNLKQTFVEAKSLLNDGKMVFFTGTPCQIEGLYSYLNKDYENLLTQDVICHGVPSPKIWKEYLKYINKDIEEIDFRNKEQSSWGDFQLKIKFTNDTYYKNHDEDIFMKLFLNDNILRESCYKCNFKKENRVSDITLADFWGINNIDKTMNDDKGTSLVILNSNKGKEIFESLSDNIVKKEVDFKKAIEYNKSMISSVSKGEYFDRITELVKQNKFKQIFEI